MASDASASEGIIDGARRVVGIEPELLEAALQTLRRSLTSSDETFALLCKACVNELEWLKANKVSTAELPFFAARYRQPLKERLLYIAQNPLDPESLFWLSFYLSALHQERTYNQSQYTDADIEVATAFDQHLLKLQPRESIRIEYLRNRLARDLLLHAANSRQKLLEQRISEKESELDSKVQTIGGWTQNLEGWNKRVVEIEALLKRHGEELNFVGLSRAFSLMAEKVKTEKASQIKWLVLLGVSLVITPFAPAILLAREFANPSGALGWIPFVTPFIVVELVMLYFFRILLRNFYSLDAQQLQLELRKSLCAFVQSYAEFASRARSESDPKVLERFEALVFSGIAADPAAIPSQFDGVEQLAKFVRELRGGKE